MTLLLSSYVCDYCDGIVEMEAPFRAFVAWPRGKKVLERAYVFPTRIEAESWVRAVRRKGIDIREVRLAREPRWQKSAGTVKDISLADSLYEVYPDHRHPPGGNRASLV